MTLSWGEKDGTVVLSIIWKSKEGDVFEKIKFYILGTGASRGNVCLAEGEDWLCALLFSLGWAVAFSMYNTVADP